MEKPLLCSIASQLMCSKEKNLPPGSKHVRLCLACQAVENMFTSGGRSYSVLISSLTRRNLPHMLISICQNWHKRACQQQWGPLLLFFVNCFFDWLTERTSWPEGLLVACVVIFSQLRLPNCQRTVPLLLHGLVLQHEAAYFTLILKSLKAWIHILDFFLIIWQKYLFTNIQRRERVNTWQKWAVSLSLTSQSTKTPKAYFLISYLFTKS